MPDLSPDQRDKTKMCKKKWLDEKYISGNYSASWDLAFLQVLLAVWQLLLVRIRVRAEIIQLKLTKNAKHKKPENLGRKARPRFSFNFLRLYFLLLSLLLDIPEASVSDDFE